MENTNEIKDFRPPSWMDRREKQSFNAVQKLRKSRLKPLNEAEIPLLIDYVRTMSRISTLQAVFDSDNRAMRSNPNFAVTKARLVATARQIDASTKMAQGMRDRLTGQAE